MEKRKFNWKTIAIIFITLFILETLTFVSLYSLGKDILEKEQYCSNDVCYDSKWVSYYYDYVDDFCYCYDIDGRQQIKYLGET